MWSAWHLPHAKPYATQMHQFPLNANLEATALPRQRQEGADGQGVLLAGEARGPNRQAVHMGTDCHHIQAATSERFSEWDPSAQEAIQMVWTRCSSTGLEGPGFPKIGWRVLELHKCREPGTQHRACVHRDQALGAGPGQCKASA